ncbi:ligase-associated DNA damage response exonuclease [Telmatocola sphagniphila]|uniref:Ligase-associated DNA damage response exonuclease n=1 Tax=Telmatocola sphagniphila TaxID=1123043 RepID=A0A8E6B9B3_9BACT|nr:ligase-associated DNA damage response exonuclease [Telmatocola sphagniphila]QVL33779.1 ligase-associated DNA damage response exonuclease [Telmatocola sphagniphila]
MNPTSTHRPGEPLIQVTESGLFCERGAFYIDPWRPVDRAIITHAHSDHARRGCGRYLTTTAGRRVLQSRMEPNAVIQTVNYGEVLHQNGVQVSLHSAGHVLGSAQIRVEYRGEVWGISGDYKLAPDPTCTAFEPVRCHTFVTESTFGLPIYRWESPATIFASVNSWWQQNRTLGRASIIYAYSLGKAQRLLAGLDTSIGPIFCHGAVKTVNQDYRDSGIPLPPTQKAEAKRKATEWQGALIIAPPSAMGTPWVRKFGDASEAYASGWMAVRGTRRRRGVDRGFVLSDHADWPGLLSAIAATGAETILATHGSTAVLVRWLREQGLQAQPLRTEYQGESEEAAAVAPAEGASE